MAVKQFDLYRTPSAPLHEVAPYLVVLSSHLFADLTEVVVAPVVRHGQLEASSFDVPVEWNSEAFNVSVIGLAAIRSIHLRDCVGSLLKHEFDIRRALDRLFTGF
ncbi:MAG: CcdB family protein [Brevundimonas sp.]